MRQVLAEHCEPPYARTPDVILIGEMRDRETIETALVAAETGHLVLSTLHNGLQRIYQSNHFCFEPHHQQQVRYQLQVF